jgi:hypothetical protein
MYDRWKRGAVRVMGKYAYAVGLVAYGCCTGW